MQGFFVMDLQSQATVERWKSKQHSVNWSLKSNMLDWSSNAINTCDITKTAGTCIRLHS